MKKLFVNGNFYCQTPCFCFMHHKILLDFSEIKMEMLAMFCFSNLVLKIFFIIVLESVEKTLKI